MKKITHVKAINKACKLMGSQKKLAEALDLTTSNISQWKQSDAGVPFKHCLKIQEITGVKCELLNPTINWKYLRGKK